jgi:hypothetical protein
MAGYLDQYGADDARREKTSRLAFLALGVVVLGILVWWLLYHWDRAEILRETHIARFFQKIRNSKQEGEVQQFLHLVQAHDYKNAYAMWGCTDANPCTGYPMTSFLEDWGPQRDVSNAGITRSRSCGSGVIVTASIDKNRQERLWVQRDNGTIGYSPFPSCPGFR